MAWKAEVIAIVPPKMFRPPTHKVRYLYIIYKFNPKIYILQKQRLRKGVVEVEDYQNIVPHIDIDRSIGSIDYFSFDGLNGEKIAEFKEDIESHNDAIELHLIRTSSYKEALILRLKNSREEYTDVWKELLRAEQKTFGGSKIFYINRECSKMLVLAVSNETSNKIAMVITRLNKINEKIGRTNSRIKKENVDLYSARIKSKTETKKKEDIINLINQNLKV